MKKLLLFFAFFILLIPNSVFSHTNLVNSTPSDGELLTISPDNIILEFNTRIEMGSQFHLNNSIGSDISVTAITVEDNRLVGYIPQELQDGGYTVNWHIIGADGHPIEGNFSFTFEIEDTDQQFENNDTDRIVDEEQQTPLEEKVVQEVVEPNKRPTFLPITAILLATIAGGIFIYLMRKGKIQ